VAVSGLTDVVPVAPDVPAGRTPGAGAVPGVLGAALALRKVLVGFDPAALAGRDSARVAEELALTEKACAAARARAAARAVACAEHKSRGFADGADWLASRTGTTLGQARAELGAAGALKGLPATSEALAAGEVSLAQAGEVARAEAEVPGSEAKLLELARRSGLGPVREQARKVVLGAADPDQLQVRQHKARSFRHWLDSFGMVRFSGALPPETGVGIVNRIDAAANRLRRAVGQDEPKEPFDAYAADALVEMLDGKGTGQGPRAEIVIVCDLLAYRRGYAHPGEACHIVGGGPVPVRNVHEVFDDAFVKAVVYAGTEVRTVAHFGRHMKAELRTALELGSPPDFDGVTCSHPGCERRYGLEWDHIDPVANNGPTSYNNLQPLCKPHHWEKTERDRQAGLIGPRPPSGSHAPPSPPAVPSPSAVPSPPAAAPEQAPDPSAWPTGPLAPPSHGAHQ